MSLVPAQLCGRCQQSNILCSCRCTTCARGQLITWQNTANGAQYLGCQSCNQYEGSCSCPRDIFFGTPNPTTLSEVQRPSVVTADAPKGDYHCHVCARGPYSSELYAYCHCNHLFCGSCTFIRKQ